jgi:hypothetical protein
MPELNNEYALNSYNLLKDAYGDSLPVSQEDFLNKIKNDRDGKYRDNVYNLLRDKYGQKLQEKVAPNEFRDKFFTSDFQEESDQLSNQQEKVSSQMDIIEKDGIPEMAPKEWLKDKKSNYGFKYKPMSDEALSKEYWKEQSEIVSSRQERVKADMSVEEKAFEISGLERQAIEEDITPNLVEEGYDIDVIIT